MMFEAFSDGYYVGRLYVEPYGGDRPAMHRAQHVRVNEQVYASGEGVERTDAPLVMKLADCHFPVHGAEDVPTDTLALPTSLLSDCDVTDLPGLRDVLLARADRAAQLLEWFTPYAVNADRTR